MQLNAIILDNLECDPVFVGYNNTYLLMEYFQKISVETIAGVKSYEFWEMCGTFGTDYCNLHWHFT